MIGSFFNVGKIQQIEISKVSDEAIFGRNYRKLECSQSGLNTARMALIGRNERWAVPS